MSSPGQRHNASSIRFEEVTKQFPGGGRPAVDRVTLEVAPGEFIVLLGPSGCGKTTLLKMVNRLYDLTGGWIFIDDTPIKSIPVAQLRRRIGYVIQQTGLFPHMRVEDNIAVVPKLLRWDKARIRQRTAELLDLVGLPSEQYRRRYPGQLSGGQQQRVGLARALAAEPTTLLMDEPFGALDAITRSRLQDELKAIHTRLGQTILFVTHDIEEAVKLADRIVVMREGRVVQYDEPRRIVMRPADAFVSELVGAEDVLRRLSLLPVDTALQPLDGLAIDGLPRIDVRADLRSALSMLLDQPVDWLVAVDADGSPVGALDIASIEAAGVPDVRGTRRRLGTPA